MKQRILGIALIVVSLICYCVLLANAETMQIEPPPLSCSKDQIPTLTWGGCFMKGDVFKPALSPATADQCIAIWDCEPARKDGKCYSADMPKGGK